MTRTWFVDIDGTILKHRNNAEINGTLFAGTEGTEADGEELLPSVAEFFSTIAHDHIVLTTARLAIHKTVTEAALKRFGIPFDHIIYDLGSGPRILINDVKPADAEDNILEKELETAYAVNVKRNGGLRHLISDDGLC